MPRKGPHRYGAYEKAHKDETADRMAARRLMVRLHGDPGPGVDVDHVKAIKGGGSGRDPRNLRFRDASENRGDKTY